VRGLPGFAAESAAWRGKPCRKKKKGLQRVATLQHLGGGTNQKGGDRGCAGFGGLCGKGNAVSCRAIGVWKSNEKKKGGSGAAERRRKRENGKV